LMVPQMRPAARSPAHAWRSPPRMPSETWSTTEKIQWGPLIRAIAAHQDRSAFATLFEYFGPRIKALMQRSGVSGAKAEELAEETMWWVWRKAALFDPATTGAAACIFTIARNLRIDAHRRERRGGRSRPLMSKLSSKSTTPRNPMLVWPPRSQ